MATKTAPAALRAALAEPIRSGESYRLEEFKARAGLSAWAFRAAKRAGLTVRRVGRRAYITGDDWLAFLNSKGN